MVAIVNEKLWGIEDVMNYTGLSRKATVHLLTSTNAPVLPRRKNQKFRVPQVAFIEWWKGGKYEEV